MRKSAKENKECLAEWCSVIVGTETGGYGNLKRCSCEKWKVIEINNY